jgi:hypothetical protein
MVDVKKPGRFRITLRQLPKEANAVVQAVRARIEVAGLEQETAVPPDSRSVVFEIDLPAGKTKLLTYLYDKKGTVGGAYFAEVEAL